MTAIMCSLLLNIQQANTHSQADLSVSISTKHKWTWFDIQDHKTRHTQSLILWFSL